MIIGTAGHIDHGKTSLVRALTGVDTDRLKEEKLRGISIELGYAYTPLVDGEVLGFVDVPGHERLVHTMVAGAGGIDYALLVVAADDGVMPQTREHLAILELLGIAHGAVALTKGGRSMHCWRPRRCPGQRSSPSPRPRSRTPVWPHCARTCMRRRPSGQSTRWTGYFVWPWIASSRCRDAGPSRPVLRARAGCRSETCSP
jgi:selenocysteine-specific elongation factor